MKIHRLSQRNVDTAKPGTHNDGGGLRLIVTNSRAKRWTLRYTLNGKQREMGLGCFPDVSLNKARERARQYRSYAKENIDPILIRNKNRRKNAEASEKALNIKNISTFTSCAARYICTHRRSWQNHKHAKQWTRTLKTYVRPVIGKKPVNTITTEEIKAILIPIWYTKTETAKRLQARIEKILDFAIAHGYIDGNTTWTSYSPVPQN